LAKHSETSWKQDHPSTLLTNSVQKADRAVKQSMSHPENTTIEDASHAISHAENALFNAEQQHEHMDTVKQNKNQLVHMKKKLNKVQEIVEDREYETITLVDFTKRTRVIVFTILSIRITKFTN